LLLSLAVRVGRLATMPPETLLSQGFETQLTGQLARPRTSSY
jgi:hypothetical protein